MEKEIEKLFDELENSIKKHTEKNSKELENIKERMHKLQKMLKYYETKTSESGCASLEKSKISLRSPKNNVYVYTEVIKLRNKVEEDLKDFNNWHVYPHIDENDMYSIVAYNDVSENEIIVNLIPIDYKSTTAIIYRKVEKIGNYNFAKCLTLAIDNCNPHILFDGIFRADNDH